MVLSDHALLKDSSITLIRKREQDARDNVWGIGLASPPHFTDDETEAQGVGPGAHP